MKKLAFRLFEIALLAIFCILIWFVGEDIQINHWIPLKKPENRLILIGAIVFLWVLSLIVKHFNTKRIERKLATSFLEYSLKKVEGDDTTALQAFKEKIEHLMQDLKTQQVLSGRKRIRLQKLPWFLVIGSPGSGKTTLLEQSGMDFSFLSRLSQQLPGQVFEIPWFAAEEAVFLEYLRFQTDAEWSEANNHEAWQLVLKTLKSYKNWPAVNGVIIVVDMVAFLREGEVARQNKIAGLRHYLKDIYELIKTRLPIYIVMSKCDQLAGFLEYFARFSLEERGQILGFTLSEELNEHNLAEILDEKYEILIEQLNSKLMNLLEQESEPEIREQLCFFPKQMALIKATVIQSMTAVLIPNKLYELVNLRGIYFTSSLPQDAVLCNPIGSFIGEKFGLSSNPVREMIQGSAFFIRKLFKDIILPEAWILEQGRAAYKNRYWLRYLFFAMVVLGMLVGSLALNFGYFYNKAQAVQAREYLEIWQQNTVAKNQALTLKERLQNWELLRKAWEVYSLNPHQWLLSYHIYQSPSIEKALKNKLQSQLENELLPVLQANLEHLLRKEDLSCDLTEELFKGYLALGYPRQLPKPWLAKAAAYSWSEGLGLGEEEVVSLKKQLDFILEGSFEPLALDPQLVAVAKNYLFNTDIANRVYQALNEQIEAQKHLSINLLKEINNQGIFASHEALEISQYYTQKGLASLYLPRVLRVVQDLQSEDALIRLALDEPPQSISTQELILAVHKLYAKDYLNHWQNALMALAVSPFQTFEEAASKFDILASADSPLIHLLKLFDDNIKVILAFEQLSLKESPLAAVYTFIKSEESSKNTGKERLLKSIEAMAKYFNGLKEQKDVYQASYQATKDSLNRQTLTPINELMNQLEQLPQPMQTWMETLSVNSWGILMDNTNSYLNQRWQKEVMTPYQKVKGYFPFEPKGTLSLSLESFEGFFAKDGIINKFVQNYLAPYLERSKESWRWKCFYQRCLSSSDALPQQLQQLSKMSRQLCPDKGVDVQFWLTPFSLSPNIASIHLKIGEEDIVYRHGPQSAFKLSWQPEIQNERIVVNFRGFNGENLTKSFEEPWSLLRLIDWGTLNKDESLDGYRVKLQIKDYQAEFLLKVKGKEAFEALLQGVELPDYF